MHAVIADDSSFEIWKKAFRNFGNFKGKIDGEWGPGSISAYDRFADEIDAKAYSRDSVSLLVTVSRVADVFDSDAENAIDYAKRMKSGLTKEIQKKALPVGRKICANHQERSMRWYFGSNTDFGYSEMGNL